MSQYLGDISAYALAVSQGYTGTEEEYAELMASYATVGQTAVTAAQTATTKASEAATSATTATNKASEATTAATTATTKAGEASTSASTATSAKDTAVSASQTATSKATEATTAAATAVSAKNDAVSANTAAQSAKTAAQTAQTGAETAAASVQSSAAQIQTNADDISELKEDINDCFDAESVNPINWLDINAIETGCFYWTNGKNTNASYNATGLIPVTEGETLYFTRGNLLVSAGRSYFTMRFVVGYADDGTTVKDSASYVDGSTGYTVPSDVKYVRFSNDGHLAPDHIRSYTMVQTVSGLIDFEEYFAPYTEKILKAECNNDEHINELISEANKRYITNGLEFSFDVNSNDHIFNDDDELVQDMFGYSIIFNGRLSALSDLVIGHGYSTYMGGYVRITPTQFSYYMGTETNPRVAEAHNLTFKDYITVRIDAKPNFAADFTIYTNGGVYTKTNQPWDVRRGALQFRSISGTNTLSGCTFSYISRGWGERIHLYGDSYFGVYSDKWTQYLVNNGWMKNNLNAYPGRASAEALKVLKNVIRNSNPEKIVWCLGMNDGDDDGEVDASWKACVDELMEICEARNIELILATIPNVPSVDNTYKNAYVIASGHRYIDFASAVGASSGTTWYDNMLSSDMVHPDTQGAIALFNQAIADVPELMQ